MKWSEWQALAEDEDHWLDDVEPGLASAEHLHDHVLRLHFADQPEDVAYELDFAPLLVDDNPGASSSRCVTSTAFAMWKQSTC